MANAYGDLGDTTQVSVSRSDGAELSSAEDLDQTDSTNANLARRAINWIEKWLLALVLGGFIAGILVASVSQPVIHQVDSTINLFMSLYDYVAPIAIFLILSPSLARMFASRKTGKFGLLVLNWFAIRKILASVWAIIFVLAVFRIPILPQGAVSLTDGLGQAFTSVGDMMLTSTYFWAMYAAVAVSLISIKMDRLTRFLEKIMDTVEMLGSYLRWTRKFGQVAKRESCS